MLVSRIRDERTDWPLLDLEVEGEREHRNVLCAIRGTLARSKATGRNIRMVARRWPN